MSRNRNCKVRPELVVLGGCGRRLSAAFSCPAALLIGLAKGGLYMQLQQWVDAAWQTLPTPMYPHAAQLAVLDQLPCSSNVEVRRVQLFCVAKLGRSSCTATQPVARWSHIPVTPNKRLPAALSL